MSVGTERNKTEAMFVSLLFFYMMFIFIFMVIGGEQTYLQTCWLVGIFGQLFLGYIYKPFSLNENPCSMVEACFFGPALFLASATFYLYIKYYYKRKVGIR